ncbi:MAG: DUF3786 domain-containing protein [Spirochaetaceae bacterium]|nr:DUF3786 domain-containing protein [Spirochaetaceae bacterium]
MKLLKGCDFDRAQKRLGFDREADGALAVDFLGRRWRISHNGVEAVTGKDTDDGVFEVNTRSVLGYYALSEADCEPEMDFYPINHFSHGIFEGGGAGYGDGLARLFREATGGEYKRFAAGAERLGLVFEKEREPGKYVWSYRLFPKLPVKVVYYEGDEDFPSDIKVLYDRTAPIFFKFEPLAVLSNCFIQALCHAARAG